MIPKPEFITRMIEAYIRHHGYQPNRQHLREFGVLYDLMREEVQNS